MRAVVAMIVGAFCEAMYIVAAFVRMWTRRAWRHLNGYDQRW